MQTGADPEPRGPLAETRHAQARRSRRPPLLARATALPLLLGLFAVAVCLYSYEVVFLGRTFSPLGLVPGVMGEAGAWGYPGETRPDFYRVDPGAAAWQFEPWSREVGNAYLEGRVPLWNAHQGFGAPFLANAQSGGLDPLRLPLFLSRDPLVWDLYYLGRAFLGLVAVALFAARLGLGPSARIVAAFAYVFSGFHFIRGTSHKTEIYFLLPAVLWGTELLLQGRRRSGLLVVAATVALSTLSGMPECTLLTFVYAAAYGGFRLLTEARNRRAWRAALAPAALLAIGWLVGLGLSAPMTVPLAEYISQARTIHTAESEFGLFSKPIAEIGWLGVPYLPGLPNKHLNKGAGAATDENDFSGMAVLVLAAAGVVSLRGDRQRSVGLFALGAALLVGAKLFGVPLINELGRLPLLNLTLFVVFAPPLLTFSLALLAALGVQAALDRRLGARTSLGLAALAAHYLVLAGWLNRSLLEEARSTHLISTFGVAAVVALAACLLLWSSRAQKTLLVGGGCCLLVALELFWFSPRNAYQDRYDPFTVPPFIKFLQAERANGQPFRLFATQGLLYPNIATAFQLDDVRVIDPLTPSRSLEYVHLFLAPGAVDRYDGIGQGFAAFRGARWLDLANVRYFVVPASAPEPLDEQFENVYRGEVKVYENRNALPRAFLVGGVRAVANPDQAAAAMKEPGFDPSLVAVVEGAPTSLPSTSVPNPVGSARIERYSAQRVEIAVDAAQSGLLVLTDAYFPGWRAEIDGQPAQILPTNLAFRGVLVQPGSQRVTFTYAPTSFTVGLAIAAIAAIALVLTVVLLPRLGGSAPLAATLPGKTRGSSPE